MISPRVRQKVLTHQRHEQSGFAPKKSIVDRILAAHVPSERLRCGATLYLVSRPLDSVLMGSEGRTMPRDSTWRNHEACKRHASWLRLVEAGLLDMGLAGPSIAWAMARRRLKWYRRKPDAATRCSADAPIRDLIWPNVLESGDEQRRRNSVVETWWNGFHGLRCAYRGLILNMYAS